MAETASPLVAEALSGGNPDLQLMAARGLLPVPPEELIPLQVSLAASSDPQISAAAREALEATEPRILANYLDSEADEGILAYFATEVRHPFVVETLLRRRDVPHRLLLELAPGLVEDQQEILLLRQDVIVSQPEVLDALETNPHLSSYAARRIREYREHLLPRQPREAPEVVPEEEEITEEVVAAALKAAEKEAPGGERDHQTGLTEAQIRSLPVPVRLKLTRGASRTLRSILLRDPNPQVAVGVLKSNPVSEQEVELICHNRSMCEEVLEEISRRRDWVRKPAVVHALVQNPRTPTGIAVRFVPRLSVRELRELARNRNVPDAVRRTADRLYKMKRH